MCGLFGEHLPTLRAPMASGGGLTPRSVARGMGLAASPSTWGAPAPPRSLRGGAGSRCRSLIALLAGVGSPVRVLVWFGVVQVIGLSMPAGREICRQRTVDESGNGYGVHPAGVPLQGEWHELAGRHRAEDCLGVGGRQGWDQQDPVNVGLVGPADGCQVSVGELDGRRGDACGVECLALGQDPGGEQGLGGGAPAPRGRSSDSAIVSRLARAWSGRRPTTSGFGTEHLGGASWPVRETGRRSGPHRCQPVTTASLSLGSHIRCSSDRLPVVLRWRTRRIVGGGGEHWGGGRGNAQVVRDGASPRRRPMRRAAALAALRDLVENDRRAGGAVRHRRW